jgi:hypothetical protein
MNHLDWLIRYRFGSLSRREFDWVFTFDGDACLVASCLWRLIENGRILVTSNDDGHQFDLPAPVDAAGDLNSRLKDASVESIELREGTLDLRILFDTGHIIELLPDSAGYEAWDLSRESQQFIAVGGGAITIFDERKGAS